jgi:signal transduction histidine kinase
VLARSPLDARQSEIVSLIEQSSQALDRLLADLLNLSRIETGRLDLIAAPFQLSGTIMAAARLAQVQAEEKGLAFRLDIDQSAKAVFVGDADRLRQVVLNLVANAVKFTSHGEVSVSVAARGGDETTAEIEIEVCDTGIGFDQRETERLFQRFEQADPQIARLYGGAGLGLSICKSLIDAMGGRIGARSTPGQGSTFTVTVRLPRAPAQGNRLRILAVDDNPANRRVLELILESAGADIVLASAGAEAVAAHAAGRFDLILMDMAMPGMDGAEATRAIRARERETGAARTPIAMLSADSSDAQRTRAASAGADHYIAKPLTAASLFEGAERTLAAAQTRAV